MRTASIPVTFASVRWLRWGCSLTAPFATRVDGRICAQAALIDMAKALGGGKVKSMRGSQTADGAWSRAFSHGDVARQKCPDISPCVQPVSAVTFVPASAGAWGMRNFAHTPYRTCESALANCGNFSINRSLCEPLNAKIHSSFPFLPTTPASRPCLLSPSIKPVGRPRLNQGKVRRQCICQRRVQRLQGCKLQIFSGFL